MKTDATPNAQQYRGVFLTKRDPGTSIWSDPLDVTSIDATLAENVFPAMSKFIGDDRNVHMYVQWDNEPGLNIRGDEDPSITDNYIVYKALNLDGEVENVKNVNEINVSVGPNPVSDFVKINAENINKVEVFNLLGAKIMVKYGKNANVINMNNLTSGSYFLRIFTEKGTVVKKIQKK